MKTLFDRLSEDNRQKVLNYQLVNTKKEILKSLNENHFYTDLKLSEAIAIHECLNSIFEPFNFYTFQDYFSHENTF